METVLNIEDNNKKYAFIGDAKKGELEIKGVFLPEKLGKVFIPVFDWIQNLHTTSEENKLTVLFKIVFANSPCYHMFRHIILLLNELANKHNFNVTVFWLYEETDAKHEKEGEELRADYSHNIDIKLVEVDKMESVL